jgi:hypothetical protein
LQRDLAHLLEDLALDFPLLASLVERHAGGQKRLPLGDHGEAEGRNFVAASIMEQTQSGTPEAGKTAEPPAGYGDSTLNTQPSATEAALEPSTVLPAARGARRPAHYGLDIQFEDIPDENSLGRLVESTVWVNRAHPAYRRALASRALGYHIALTVAMSLAPLAVESPRQSQFILTFLTRWGEAIDKPSARKRNLRAPAR